MSGETLAYNLWKRLSELFESKNSLNKTFLIRKIVNLKYKDVSPMVAEHLSHFQNMVNQLTTMEIVLDDELLALLLLSSLPDSWETLVVSLSNFGPNGKFTFGMVKDSLLNEEIRRKGNNSQNEALVMESRGRHMYKNSQKFNNRSKRCNDHIKSRGKSKPKTNITCFHCNKPGHVIKDCWFLKRENSRDRSNNYNKKKIKMKPLLQLCLMVKL